MLQMARPRGKARANIRHAIDEFDRLGGLVAEVVDVEDPDNPKLKERVRRAASPLRRLQHAGRISDSAFEAGRRFAGAYTASHMGPLYCGTNPDRIMVDVGVRNPEQLVAFNVAAEECFEAIKAMGELGGSILECVVGQEMAIVDWVSQRARMNRWGVTMDPTSAGHVLSAILGALDGWYRRWDRSN